jgi:hypothetical protein
LECGGSPPLLHLQPRFPRERWYALARSQSESKLSHSTRPSPFRKFENVGAPTFAPFFVVAEVQVGSPTDG